MPSKTVYKIIFMAAMLALSPDISSRILAEETFYHLRFDVSTVDGRVTGSRLHMVPGKKDFRAHDFSTVRSGGVAVLSANESPVVDMESRAKHDCLKQILVRSGLKSIRSWQASRNGIQTDEIIMSYEGVVKKPFKIISRKISDDRSTYRVEMEVSFSPIAFPDRWPGLERKNAIRDAINEFLFIFR